jgi:flagellar biosynthesis/type III secretory pathway chaperone
LHRKRRRRPSENALPYLNPVPITATLKAIPERLSRPLQKARKNNFQNGMLMMHNQAAQV